MNFSFPTLCVSMNKPDSRAIDTERIHFAQWVLERNLYWIATAESKVGFVVAIVTAMLAALATAYNSAAEVRLVGAIATGLTIAFCVASIFFAAVCVRSRTTGPERSLIFFGCIEKKSAVDYESSLLKVDLKALLGDLSAQIHRNAEIASEKHRSATRSIYLAFAAAPCWSAAIAILVRG